MIQRLNGEEYEVNTCSCGHEPELDISIFREPNPCFIQCTKCRAHVGPVKRSEVGSMVAEWNSIHAKEDVDEALQCLRNVKSTENTMSYSYEKNGPDTEESYLFFVQGKVAGGQWQDHIWYNHADRENGFLTPDMAFEAMQEAPLMEGYYEGQRVIQRAVCEQVVIKIQELEIMEKLAVIKHCLINSKPESMK